MKEWYQDDQHGTKIVVKKRYSKNTCNRILQYFLNNLLKKSLQILKFNIKRVRPYYPYTNTNELTILEI